VTDSSTDRDLWRAIAAPQLRSPSSERLQKNGSLKKIEEQLIVGRIMAMREDDRRPAMKCADPSGASLLIDDHEWRQ